MEKEIAKMSTSARLESSIATLDRPFVNESSRRHLRRRLRRLAHLDAAISLLVMVLILVCLAFPQAITSYDPYKIDISSTLQPPSTEHWMGTDDFGRDIYTRVVYGTRYSLAMGFVVVVSSSLIGLLLGGAAGFFGGWVDEVIMRFTDLAMGFPALLFAMVITAAIGASLNTAIIAATAVWWPSYVRLLRGQVLSVKSEPYIEAARSLGASNRRIIGYHILPNSWAPIIVRGTMDLGRAVIFVGTLSFIGLGAQPPIPEWGTILAEARSFILGAWWYITFPGLAIFFAVFAFSLLGDIVDEILRPGS